MATEKKRSIAKVISLTIIISLGLVVFFVVFIYPNFFLSPSGESPTWGTKAEEQSLATALESYYIDNNCYPLPDYDQNGRPVIPRVLSTPIAFVTSLFHDKFKDNGKGYYGYGVDTTLGWIVASYGPDRMDGNLGMPGGTIMDFPKAWSDKSLGFSLEASGLTYDPSNGLNSPGDIWRRGP